MKLIHKISNIKWLKVTFWLLCILTLLSILIVENVDSKETPWTKTKINVVNHKELAFVQNETIDGILKENNFEFKDQVIESIDKLKIEEVLQKNPFIKQAEVYSDFHGVLSIDIKQKAPLLRIERKSGSYYLDHKGEYIPLSDNFTARVPIFHVESDSTQDQSLFDFYKNVEKRPLLKSQIADVYVNSFEEYTFVPQFGNFIVELGDSDDLEEKFIKFEHTMNYILKNEGWEKYKAINLAFKDQVVCTKK